jgi:UDP-N-acetyl-D-galactosamine dehydrogenase
VGARVLVLGLAFKENCPDSRNTKVVDIIHGLKRYGVDPVVSDPCADASEVRRQYGIELTAFEDVSGADCVVIAVAHDCFRAMGLERFDNLFIAGEPGDKVIVDIKGILDKKRVEALGYRYWRL